MVNENHTRKKFQKVNDHHPLKYIIFEKGYNKICL